jgi:hypothetical protein
VHFPRALLKTIARTQMISVLLVVLIVAGVLALCGFGRGGEGNDA